MSKTKYMVFSKGGKYEPQGMLYIGNEILMQCESYCYLGVIFIKSGSFKVAEKALNDKARGAMYSILRNIYKHQAVNVDIMIDIFDKMIMPIALYNCEVWGTNMLPQKPSSNNFFDRKFLIKNTPEITQSKYLKSVLRVPSRTSSWAVNTEIGRYPIITKVLKLMVKYLCHLKDSKSPIVNADFEISSQLDNQGKKSWVGFVKRILKFLDLESILYTSDQKVISLKLSKLDLNIKKNYVSVWKREMDELTDTKLDILKLVKTCFRREQYISQVRIPNYRSALTKMRISAHKFPIEIDRYNNISRCERFCPLGCQVIGDEFHYLLHCAHPSILELRSRILNEFSNMNAHFENLNDIDKVIMILNPPNSEAAHLAGKLCYKLQCLFKNITY